MIRPTGASHAPERFSALRPPLDSGSVKQGCKPRTQKCAAGTMEVVCMVSSAVGDARPHPEERACSVVLQSRTSVRASRRMRTATAWALMLRDASQRSELGKHPYSLRAAMLLSMRAPRPIIRPCPRRPAKHHLRLYERTAGAISLFPIVIYNDFCNSHVSLASSAQILFTAIPRR